MKRSIFSKIFIGYVGIIILLSALLVMFTFKTIRAHYLATATTSLENLGTAFIPRVIPFLEKQQFDLLDVLVKEAAPSINARITVIDSQGVVIADSEEDPRTMENHKARPEIIHAYKGSQGSSLRYSTTVREKMLYVALPIGYNNDVLRVSFFLKDIDTLLNRLKVNIGIIALVAIITGLGGAFLNARHLSKPIQELSRVSRRIASGHYDEKVLVDATDELCELAYNFNEMAKCVKTSFQNVSHQKEELESIIAAMQEGLVVIDREEKIILSNESFKKIINSDAVDGKFYWEVVRIPSFSALMKKVFCDTYNALAEIMFAERTFLCSATFLEAQKGIVVLFHDITQLKDLERVKKDFILNVSHELRTPLTAIKGFVETVHDDVDEKNKHYLSIVQRHTDRLINIVQDLLLLSNLETTEGKVISMEYEKADLQSLVENVAQVFGPQLKEKKITLTIVPSEGPLFVKADVFKLEQMFVNLIDNAIKYTEEGAITITLHADATHIIIDIADTGIGIPPEQMKRIFERFYVVDKSRSKKLGGTGLGLSIVKHIVLLHNGTIQVSSVPAQGTTFTIKFSTLTK